MCFYPVLIVLIIFLVFHFKINPKIIPMKKLPLPKSQVQEVLYELINRISIDRRTMMLSCGILNLTARISDLRYNGVQINNTEICVFNKFGRVVKYVQYSLQNKKEAIEYYKSINSKIYE